MAPFEPPHTSFDLYVALAEQYMQGTHPAALVMLLFRLSMEVEALREALSSPQTPEAVREAYRQAYARIAVLSHNSAGPSGGPEKILRRFFPSTASEPRFAAEQAMMNRLGMTPQAQQAVCDKMAEVEMYT